MKKRVIVSRFVRTNQVASRLIQLPHVRYSDSQMLESQRLVNTERPVRALKRLTRHEGFGALSVALTKAGVWPTHRVTTVRQLEACLGCLPRVRVLRVLEELRHG